MMNTFLGDSDLKFLEICSDVELQKIMNIVKKLRGTTSQKEESVHLQELITAIQQLGMNKLAKLFGGRGVLYIDFVRKVGSKLGLVFSREATITIMEAQIVFEFIRYKLTNKNANWISKFAQDLGIEKLIHTKEMILAELEKLVNERPSMLKETAGRVIIMDMILDGPILVTGNTWFEIIKTILRMSLQDDKVADPDFNLKLALVMEIALLRCTWHTELLYVRS